MKKGKLIVFCGIDGCGKTTQINILNDFFKHRKVQYINLKQPTDWFRKNELVRKRLDENDQSVDVRFLSLLSATDRLYQYEQVICPAIQSKKVVIMDRYVFSAYAYMQARGLNDYEWLKSINKFIPLPDITFYLDINPENALERVLLRDAESTKKEEQDIVFMSKVRKNYLKLSDEYNFCKLNAAEPPEKINQQILDKLIDMV